MNVPIGPRTEHDTERNGPWKGRQNNQRQAKQFVVSTRKKPGTGVWWVRYADGDGRIRREIAGSKSNASDLYTKRKAEVLTKKKLPEKLQVRAVRFLELAEDGQKYCKANNQGQQFDLYRIGRLKAEFGNRPALIPIVDLRLWFDEQEWENATYNRYKTTLSLIYRLGMENGNVQANPAKRLMHKTEDNERVRFLNQFAPAKTEVEYLSRAQMKGRACAP